MSDLRKRFGKLVAAHRRRIGLTQEALAERAALSVDMISKIEIGATGARFPAIERLADALEVDPGELFMPKIASNTLRKNAHLDIMTRLAELPDADLDWVLDLLQVALRPRPGR